MKILLSFTGYGDADSSSFPEPDGHGSSSGVGGEGPVAAVWPGSILTMLQHRHFHHVYLLDTPETEEDTQRTLTAIRARHDATEASVISLDVQDPANYGELLDNLRRHVKPLTLRHANAEFFVNLAAGTPQMHTCWILMCASGELPARILQTRPARFLHDGKPAISELDLTRPYFPAVRPLQGPKEGAHEVTGPNIIQCAREAGLIGEDPRFLAAMGSLIAWAPFDMPVLIRGETGTGKSLAARMVHQNSARAKGPFVEVRCSGLPTDVAQSTLFGHRKGAFDGADADHTGRFEEANGGTVFLEELGDLPSEAQIKLLQALDERMIIPLGAPSGRRIDVRLIASASQDVNAAVLEGRFREDLFYRLTDAIVLPPLRQRRGDITLLANHFLDRLNEARNESKTLHPAALRRLQNARWHGNVRELFHVIERAVIQVQKYVIDASDISLVELQDEVLEAAAVPGVLDPYEGFGLEDYLRKVRGTLFERALEMAGSNQSQAARLLGVTPQAVHKYLRNRERPDNEEDLAPETPGS